MKLCAITAINDSIQDIEDTFYSIKPVLSKDFQWVIKYYKDTPSNKLLEIKNSSNFINLICQSDRSLYDGLNQALEQINSDYFYVIGSGDKINPNVALKTINYLLANSPDALFLSTYHNLFKFILKPDPSNIMNKMSCPHPSAILKTSAVRNLKGFDTRYLIASDYDLLSRFILNYKNFIISDEVLVIFKGGGMSEMKVVEAFCEESLIKSRIWNKNNSQLIENMCDFVDLIKPQLVINDAKFPQ